MNYLVLVLEDRGIDHALRGGEVEVEGEDGEVLEDSEHRLRPVDLVRHRKHREDLEVVDADGKHADVDAILGEEPGAGETDAAAKEEEEQQAHLALRALRALPRKLEVALRAERAAWACILACTGVLSSARFRRLAWHIVWAALA